MESKKGLGMGWYEFLRYFPFGLLRFFSFLSIISNLGLMYNNRYNLPDVAYFSFICIVCDFIFRIVVHSHLENYSANITNVMLLYYINRTINGMLNAYINYSFIVSLIIPVFFGTLYFINYRYFNNRSNIFINECSFWGKRKEKNTSNNLIPNQFEDNTNIIKTNNSLQNNFCRKCGEKLIEDSKFCHKCGAQTILNTNEIQS